jgi:hypothetical protein
VSAHYHWPNINDNPVLLQPRFERQGDDRPRRDGPKILKPLDEVTCFKVWLLFIL